MIVAPGKVLRKEQIDEWISLSEALVYEPQNIKTFDVSLYLKTPVNLYEAAKSIPQSHMRLLPRYNKVSLRIPTSRHFKISFFAAMLKKRVGLVSKSGVRLKNNDLDSVFDGLRNVLSVSEPKLHPWIPLLQNLQLAEQVFSRAIQTRDPSVLCEYMEQVFFDIRHYGTRRSKSKRAALISASHLFYNQTLRVGSKTAIMELISNSARFRTLFFSKRAPSSLELRFLKSTIHGIDVIDCLLSSDIHKIALFTYFKDLIVSEGTIHPRFVEFLMQTRHSTDEENFPVLRISENVDLLDRLRATGRISEHQHINKTVEVLRAFAKHLPWIEHLLKENTDAIQYRCHESAVRLALEVLDASKKA